MDLYSVIQSQINTEKATFLKDISRKEIGNTYVLKISPRANKIDVKNAIKVIYGLDVESVKTVKQREKYKAARKGMTLKRRVFTKAYVTLKNKNDILDLTKVK